LADHRLLASFPTRRSSDLRGPELAGDARFRDRGAEALRSPHPPQPRLRPPRVFQILATPGAGGEESVARARLAETRETAAAVSQDRKSTRLNSSHVKISYA